ncbi:MAG: T9SS type A sorting domain-containing protein, partial [Ignavibacteria bacterium]
NPFNPVTMINFDISKTGYVSIKVYDILGQEVATLVNESKNPGSYFVNFDGSTLSSGMYYYKLESNGFVATKKMMLIK